MGENPLREVRGEGLQEGGVDDVGDGQRLNVGGYVVLQRGECAAAQALRQDLVRARVCA
jgi:hypothetical protein